MDCSGGRLALLAAVLLLLLGSTALVSAQEAPAPAPAPTSDGVAIDQGIAYVLMLAALILTYLIHPLDAFPYNLF